MSKLLLLRDAAYAAGSYEVAMNAAVIAYVRRYPEFVRDPYTHRLASRDLLLEFVDRTDDLATTLFNLLCRIAGVDLPGDPPYARLFAWLRRAI